CIPELISLHCGFDYYEQMVRCAIGMPVSFPDPDRAEKTPCMAKLIFSECGGTLTQLDTGFINSLCSDKIQIHIDYEEGECIRPVKNATDRIGHVIMKTDNETELDEVIRLVEAHMTIEP
ncbi:MAG: hypothetical protein HUJ72_02110, partial [Blautia sp.]|nr:hypothetical protein [Blautia sp.]